MLAAQSGEPFNEHCGHTGFLCRSCKKAAGCALRSGSDQRAVARDKVADATMAASPVAPGNAVVPFVSLHLRNSSVIIVVCIRSIAYVGGGE